MKELEHRIESIFLLAIMRGTSSVRPGPALIAKRSVLRLVLVKRPLPLSELDSYVGPYGVQTLLFLRS